MVFESETVLLTCRWISWGMLKTSFVHS